jgi:hypothetical protein
VIELVLKNFLKSRRAPTARNITKDDVRNYWQWEVDNSPTKSLCEAHNRVTQLGAFLREHGVDVVGRDRNSAGEIR